MTTDQLLTWGFDAVIALTVFLGKLALDDRDRRLLKMENLISDRIRINDDRLAGVGNRISTTEIRAERAETSLGAIKETLARIERTMERMADRIEEATGAGQNR